MNGIRTLNLLWEKRLRGSYPVSVYALANDGAMTLALPRPTQVRTYDIKRLRPDGGSEIVSGFASETLQELELSSETTDALGRTTDDIYLLRAESKNRFLGERRLNFVDASLSADGRRLAALFSDMSGRNFGLACGEIGGRVAWSQDMDYILSVVSVSRDGERLAVGSENGNLWLFDAAQRTVWEFGQAEPVTALACSQDGLLTVYGTMQGAVGLIDGMGTRRWETRLNGEVARLALSAEGDLCAALLHPPGGGSALVCLVGAGRIGWEYPFEKRFLGLALSPDGRFLAVGARDGVQQVYEVVFGERSGVVLSGGRDPLAEAARLESAGDLRGAYVSLRDALNDEPTNVSWGVAFAQVAQRWREAEREAFEARRQTGDLIGAIAGAEAFLAEIPRDSQATAWLESARRERAIQLETQANVEEIEGDPANAEQLLLEAIGYAPWNVSLRQQLGALRTRRAELEEAAAERSLAQGELETGVAALERAQAVAPDAERAVKLARAQTALEFAAGMNRYNEKNYAQAIFQFKKVLARDPDHAEAKRYLGYAQKFLQTASSDDIQDRFAHLE